MGLVFTIHKDMVRAVLGCRPVFNVTIILVYAPTSKYDDNKIDNFYQQLQEIIDRTPKKDILVENDSWNAKAGRLG